MVRSRVSGELETTSGNLSAYTTPDGGDMFLEIQLHG